MSYTGIFYDNINAPNTEGLVAVRRWKINMKTVVLHSALKRACTRI